MQTNQWQMLSYYGIIHHTIVSTDHFNPNVSKLRLAVGWMNPVRFLLIFIDLHPVHIVRSFVMQTKVWPIQFILCDMDETSWEIIFPLMVSSSSNITVHLDLYNAGPSICAQIIGYDFKAVDMPIRIRRQF